MSSIDVSALPELTDKQHAFVVALLTNGGNASEAYRTAYDVASMSDDAIRVEACRLRTNPNIALWLAAHRQAGADRAALTLESHLAELSRLRELALASGNYGAAVQAEHCRGKATGLYKERHEHSWNADTEVLREGIETLPAELAVKLGRALGLPSGSGTRH